MKLAETLYRKVQLLPESAQQEALDFVEYLENKSRRDESAWSLFSLAAALRGLESDVWPEYGLDDLKERWH